MSFVLPSNVDEDFIHYTYINDRITSIVTAEKESMYL